MIDYDAHYRARDVSPAQLWVDVSFLQQLKRFGEVEHAINAYLRYQGKRAEPWMYLLLAVALEVNGRPAENVRTALGWAGFLARKEGDPFTLIEVADVMILRGVLEIPLPNNLPTVTAGELLDQAAQKSPERYEPVLLGMLLAEKAADPDRMALSIERLMELGWPGYDELWRSESQRRAEELAKRLEEQGRGDAARAMLERVRKAATRDLFLRLTWKGDAGLDLVVEEPLGATARWEEPRTVFGGAITKSGRGKSPESTYTCPRGFDGQYRVRIQTLYNNPDDPAREVELEVIKHEGLPEETREVVRVSLESGAPIDVVLSGGRRTKVLPLQVPLRVVELPGQDEGKRASASSDADKSPAARAADALRQGGSTTKPSTSIKPGGGSESARPKR